MNRYKGVNWSITTSGNSSYCKYTPVQIAALQIFLWGEGYQLSSKKNANTF